MKAFSFFVLFSLPFLVFSQRFLKGLVIEAGKNTPVPGASVFLSNTSIGTVTNSQGAFEMNVPAGQFDLVVSSIGYQTYLQTITANASTPSLVITLHPIAKELENVVVEPFEKDGWATWGTFFLESFIGTSALAKECVLQNPSVVKFRNSKKTGELTALALEPLVIQNKALGYTIRYKLETFSFNFNTHYLLVQGYPFFVPMKGNAARQRHWAARRKETYEGSMLHFMRSLYRNKLGENGFEVRALKKLPNTEKKRVQLLYKTLSSAALHANKDSAAYYESRLRQPDYFDIAAKAVLPGDSIAYAADSVTVGLAFHNYLLVLYTRELAPPEYRQYVPDAGSARMSQLYLLNERPVFIQSNGSYFDPADLLTIGYWSWSEKMATMLPFDYKLE